MAGRKQSAQRISREETFDGRLAWASCALGVLILVSSFAVIHSTHACRELYAQLQVLESSRWYLQEDYGRLLLEQSTFASHRRVEEAAQGVLNMATPDLARIRVVTP